MTKIVGHRGVKGMEHENTVQGFKLAKSMALDAVELDVIATRDGKFVVIHDDDLRKHVGKAMFVSRTDYAELAELKLVNGETIPLLYDVLALLRGIPVIIDVKSDTFLPGLYEIIDRYPEMDITITSWLTPWVTTRFKQDRPHLPAMIERYYLPFGFMRSVQRRRADGLNLRFWWLNPVTYHAAKRRGLFIQTYTVNNIHLARLIRRLYPEVWICTNHPDRIRQALQR